MGGASAAGGFAYQHAQAALRALDLASDPLLGSIRVEASNDVVDVETFTAGNVLHATLQCKRRDREYTWGANELLRELARWSELGKAHPAATYTFQTNGRLGRSGRMVQDALAQLRAGDAAAIERIAIAKHVEIDPDVCRRATIEADTAEFDTLIEMAMVRVTALMPSVSGHREAEERSTGVVHRLLKMVVGRSGNSNPSQRLILRDEVLGLLSALPEYVETGTWSSELKEEVVESLRSDQQNGVALDCLIDKGFPETHKPTRMSPEQLVAASAGCSPRSVFILAGPAGSGKSTLLKRARAATQFDRIVILVDAESYIPRRLGSLVARGINEIKYVGAYSATGLEAIKDPGVTVFIDGASEIPNDARRALALELRQLLAADIHARVLLVGRDLTALRSLLPRNVEVTPLVVEPLTRAKRIDMLSNGVEEKREMANQIAAQTERALAGAADNPQLFLLGAKLILEEHDFTNPASMYRIHIREVAQRNGYPEVTTLEAGLGIAFASLARTNRRYCDSIEWTTELKSAASVLEEQGHDVDSRELREFAFESGFVRRGSGDIIRALHDSFADYFAAVAFWRGLSKLPPLFTDDDRGRLQFYAELAGVTEALAELVARDLPFLFPSLADRELDYSDHAKWHRATEKYIGKLWPLRRPRPKVAYWNSGDTILSTVGGRYSGWIGERSLEEMVSAEYTFVADAGPVGAAAHIWRNLLESILSQRERCAISVPANDAETVERLVQYSLQLERLVKELVGEVSPVGCEAKLTDAIGPTKLQLQLLGDETSVSQRDRPVNFRYLSVLSGPRVVRAVDCSDLSEWSGRASVDSFVGKDAVEEASGLIIRGINRLAGAKWL